MLTIAPRRWISWGSSRWVSDTSAVTLVSIICFHCARSACCAGAVPSASPALLTSRSMPAKAGGRLACAACIAASSRTSNAVACTCSEPWRSTNCCNRSARRPLAITRQPPATKRSTVAAPNPEVAPVIQTVRVVMGKSRSTDGCAAAGQVPARPVGNAQGALLAFFQRDRVDAGTGQALFGRFQVGGRAERAEADAVVRLAADVDRLHVRHETLQCEFGLQGFRVAGVREGANLQQVAAAGCRLRYGRGRRRGNVFADGARLVGCCRCLRLLLGSCLLGLHLRGLLLLLLLDARLRADLGVGDAYFLLRQHRVEIELRLLGRVVAGGRLEHARRAAALGGGLRIGLRAVGFAQAGQQAAAHHQRHQDGTGDEADDDVSPARKAVAAVAHGLPALALACCHYIFSGAPRPNKSRPFFNTCRVATTSARRALRRLASSTRNWCEL